jgi:hypothetical protein
MSEVKDKEKKDGEEPVVVPADARVMWFEDKVCAALKVKNDKWKKMIAAGENV